MDAYEKTYNQLMLSDYKHIVDHLPENDQKDLLIYFFVNCIERLDLIYADNFRIEKISNIKKYNEIKNKGCCGFFDSMITINNNKYLIGCNYDH